MRPFAALLWFSAFLLPCSTYAASQTFEVMVAANSGEQEAVVCGRASRQLHRQAIDFLVKASADLRSYHRLLDLYTWQGDSREDLDKDIGARIEEVDITEASRFWSGKSCLLRGYVDVDLAPVLSKMLSDAPAMPSDGSGNGDNDSWLAMPGIIFRKVQNQRLIADAVAELSMVRLVVSEHWATTHSWPRSLSEMNLDATDFDGSEVLDQVMMEDGGVIRARLKSPLGGETILFTPEMGAMGTVGWSCTTTVQVLFDSACSD